MPKRILKKFIETTLFCDTLFLPIKKIINAMKTLTLFISILFSIFCLANDKSTKDSIWDGLDAITPEEYQRQQEQQKKAQNKIKSKKFDGLNAITVEEHERRQLANKKNGFDDLLTPRQKCLHLLREEQTLRYLDKMIYTTICKNIKEPDYYRKCMDFPKVVLKNMYNSVEEFYHIKKQDYYKCLKLKPFLNKNERDFVFLGKDKVMLVFLDIAPHFCISKNTCIKIYTSIMNEYEKTECDEPLKCNKGVKSMLSFITIMKHFDEHEFKTTVLPFLIKNKVVL